MRADAARGASARPAPCCGRSAPPRESTPGIPSGVLCLRFADRRGYLMLFQAESHPRSCAHPVKTGRTIPYRPPIKGLSAYELHPASARSSPRQQPARECGLTLKGLSAYELNPASARSSPRQQPARECGFSFYFLSLLKIPYRMV